MDEHHSQTIKTLEQNIRMYDNYYQKPDWWFKFRYDTQVKRKTCLFLLKQTDRSLVNQRVLEIGFGSGAVLFSFDQSCEIHGLEISHSAVERAEQKANRLGYKRARFGIVEGDLLPYRDKYFDVIIASHVVEHVEDDEKLLFEIMRVLNDTGAAVILIPINENYNDPNHLHRYTKQSFFDLVKKNGFIWVYEIENELLFHFVERFYFEGYNSRLRILGPIIAMLFNFPTSVLPFWAYRLIEKIMLSLGWKPRQLGCLLMKPRSSTTNVGM